MDGPIPGQSLTRPPRNALYERPPEIADPNDAVIYHMERVADPDRLDNILFSLEYGVPVKHMTQAMLTAAVAQGIHSIDVSLLVAPVLHKFIASTAEEAGVKYVEDFADTKMKAQQEKVKVEALLKKSIQETPTEEQDTGFDMLVEMSESLEGMEDIPTQGEVSEEVAELDETAEEKPRGLMSRG